MGVSKKLAELRNRKGSDKPQDAAGLAEMRIQNPDLAEFLSPYVVDGKQQPGSTILFFVDSGCVKVCVSDRAMGQRFFMVVNDWAKLWQSVTDAIYEPTTDWRQMR